jgi:2,3-bisphosphoglycerate-independent phosphoglycerate mutase
MILDGWGLSPEKKGNAPLLAKTPTLDYVYSSYPKTSLTASGMEVGLSPGEPGNSEVGHANIGLGRVVWENLPRIDQDIAQGRFFENKILNDLYDNVIKNNSTLHLIGLVSDGGVHSHIRHLISLLELAAKKKIKNVCVHMISDGRDTAPKNALEYVKQLDAAFEYFKIGKIATIIGRYSAMDRDKNWNRQIKAFDLFVDNIGDAYATAEEAINANYKNGKSDEFLEACVIGEGGKIGPKDSVVLFNHRSDRMRQTLELFTGVKKTKNLPRGVKIVSMTEYDKTQKAPPIFPPINLENTLSDLISKKGMTQLHTAETEKFAHVTYFFKAGNEKVLRGEKDEIVPSKKVSSYDKLPVMSVAEVTKKVETGLDKEFNFIVVNYANGDMVGHTGVLEAAVKACEAVDAVLLEVLAKASEKGYKVFITADHGNCEKMISEKGEPDKEHTINPVPFVFLDFSKKPFVFDPSVKYSEEDYLQYASSTPIGVLADIAPSILANLKIGQAKEMSGMDLSIAMI